MSIWIAIGFILSTVAMATIMFSLGKHHGRRPY